MADVRTFRAPTMQAALDVVRRELGSDAIILHTRQVTTPRRLWRKPIEEVEITAGLGVQVGPVAARAASTARKTAAAGSKTAASTPTTRRVAAAPTTGSKDPEDDGPEFLYAPQAARRPAASNAASTTTRSPAPRDTATAVTRAQTAATSAPRERHNALAPVASLRTTAAPATRAVPRTPPATVRPHETRSPARSPAQADADRSPHVNERLDAIERMLDDLSRTVRSQSTRDVPEELVRLYAPLIEQDVDDRIARELLATLQRKATPDQWRDPVAARAMLQGLIAANLDCGETIVPVRGRRVVAALVGATGVGKTTTLAKLAANFRLRDKISVGLVTVDTYRIAAVEQLRQYAEIIDLPMKVVTNPTEMRRALDELTGLDLVLIDTAGRSPRDDVQIEELNDLLDAADVDQAHLVLNITAGARHIEQTLDRFAAVEPNSVIVTKLDEAASFGSLLSVSRRLQCPISYVTFGQNVPDDIEPARPDRLARMILEGSRITS